MPMAMLVFLQMADGRWQMADGRWQMADGRWQIEVYFKALKIGCRAEQLRLEKRECLEPALAFYMIIAWCVLFLTMLGCDCPEMP